MRSEETHLSHIDFLVDYGDDISLLDGVRLKRELGDKLGRKVDVVSAKYLNPRIKERVLHEQIRIL